MCSFPKGNLPSWRILSTHAPIKVAKLAFSFSSLSFPSADFGNSGRSWPRLKYISNSRRISSLQIFSGSTPKRGPRLKTSSCARERFRLDKLKTESRFSSSDPNRFVFNQSRCLEYCDCDFLHNRRQLFSPSSLWKRSQSVNDEVSLARHQARQNTVTRPVSRFNF